MGLIGFRVIGFKIWGHDSDLFLLMFSGRACRGTDSPS